MATITRSGVRLLYEDTEGTRVPIPRMPVAGDHRRWRPAGYTQYLGGPRLQVPTSATASLRGIRTDVWRRSRSEPVPSPEFDPQVDGIERADHTRSLGMWAVIEQMASAESEPAPEWLVQNREPARHSDRDVRAHGGGVSRRPRRSGYVGRDADPSGSRHSGAGIGRA